MCIGTYTNILRSIRYIPTFVWLQTYDANVSIYTPDTNLPRTFIEIVTYVYVPASIFSRSWSTTRDTTAHLPFAYVICFLERGHARGTCRRGGARRNRSASTLAVKPAHAPRVTASPRALRPPPIMSLCAAASCGSCCQTVEAPDFYDQTCWPMRMNV